MGRLTWHQGIIPEDEIWVKIGGDKGGKSVKISFQICNTLNPNSVQNTYVFTVLEAKDTPLNLHIALDLYHAQVESLMNTTWRQVIVPVGTITIIIFISNHIPNFTTDKTKYTCFSSEIMSLYLICMALRERKVETTYIRYIHLTTHINYTVMLLFISVYALFLQGGTHVYGASYDQKA